MRDARAEGRAVEQRRREHVQRVEPAARLADVLGDEVARVVVLEPVAVLERVVHLGVGHRARVEPHVQDVRDAAHGGAARRVVRVGARQLVDEGAVQVGLARLVEREAAEVGLELGQRAVDVDARVGRVVRLPDGDGRAPVAVAGDRPVPRTGQPLAELAVLDVVRHPGDVVVELDHPVAERADLDEPAGHRLVDERVAAPPAVRVRVLVRLVPHDDGALGRCDPGQRPGAGLEVSDDQRVGVEHQPARVVGDLGREPALGVHRHHRDDPRGVAHGHVVLAEGRREVHDPRAVLRRDEVGREHAMGVVAALEVAERRRVAQAGQRAAWHARDHPRVLAELAGVGTEPRRGEQHVLARERAVGRDHRDVLDPGAHREGEVGRQRPGRRRPQQGEVAGLQAHADRQRGVLARGVDVVVHPQLVVGQRRLVAPAVRQDAVALVGQALVVELREGPDDGLHVADVERLVVVLEVHPARLAGDVLLPLAGVLQHRAAAGLVERRDAHLVDLRLVGDPEDPLGLELGRQAVGVPPEPALDPAAALRLVAPDDVLGVAGQQVPVVRQAVGEGRAVVEDELVGPLLPGRSLVDGGLEGAVRGPVGQDLALDRRQVGRCGDGGVRTVQGVGHEWSPSAPRGAHGRRATRTTDPDRPGTTAVPPRLPTPRTRVTDHSRRL